MSAINHRSRVVFVHVPKTAGSSMEAVAWIGDAGHRTASTLRRRMKPAQWESYFTFAFVRDPVDRFLSAYYHYVRRQAKPNEPRIYAELHRMIQQLHAEAGADGPERLVMDLGLEFDLAHLVNHINHFRPQSFFVDEDLDFIGRYEQLAADWRYVCQRAGHPHVELRHRNAAQRDPETKLSAGAIGRLERLYTEDFERWY